MPIDLPLPAVAAVKRHCTQIVIMMPVPMKGESPVMVT